MGKQIKILLERDVMETNVKKKIDEKLNCFRRYSILKSAYQVKAL